MSVVEQLAENELFVVITGTGLTGKETPNPAACRSLLFLSARLYLYHS